MQGAVKLLTYDLVVFSNNTRTDIENVVCKEEYPEKESEIFLFSVLFSLFKKLFTTLHVGEELHDYRHPQHSLTYHAL